MKFLLAVSFVFFFFCGTSNSAQDSTFDFHGIRGGMTKEELSIKLDLNRVADYMKKNFSYYEDETVNEIVKNILNTGIRANRSGHLGWKEKTMWSVKFFFTEEDKLWRLDVAYTMPKTGPRTIALRRVLNEVFKSFLIQEQKDQFVVSMIDADELEGFVERYANDYRSRM